MHHENANKLILNSVNQFAQTAVLPSVCTEVTREHVSDVFDRI